VGLRQKFEAHQLIAPTPGPATIADYKAVSRIYLLPRLGARLLAEIDAEAVTSLRAVMLSEAGAKASGRRAAADRCRPAPWR